MAIHGRRISSLFQISAWCTPASSKKLEEHGGVGHDDTNVMLLLSNPNFEAKTVTSPVETAQVAPTILKALELDPQKLESVRREHVQVLPGLGFDDDDR